jgi:hypothetical protein
MQSQMRTQTLWPLHLLMRCSLRQVGSCAVMTFGLLAACATCLSLLLADIGYCP